LSEVVCPVCNQTITVPQQYVGKNWSCPACKHRFVPMPPGETGGAGARGEGGVAASAAPRRRFSGTVVFWTFLLGAALGAALMFLFGPR